MTQAVGADVFHQARLPGVLGHDVLIRAGGEPSALLIEEEGRRLVCWYALFRAGLEIGFQGLGGLSAHRFLAQAGAFAQHGDVACIEVDISHVQSRGLGLTQAGAVDQLQYGPVPQAGQIRGVRRFHQTAGLLLIEETGQLFVLPRHDQAVHRAAFHGAFPHQKRKEGAQGGQGPLNGGAAELLHPPQIAGVAAQSRFVQIGGGQGVYIRPVLQVADESQVFPDLPGVG